MSVRQNPWPLFLLGLALGGCRQDPVFIEMSDSTFVRTMVALRQLPVGTTDQLGRARKRDSILAAFGVTGAQVESTAVRLASDPARAALIWQAIENPVNTAPIPP
ncbi:MAG: hypothetical protein HUU26_05565 [Gemmatimonadaceae bacterium]|nr:hypothetical protein [Gemmatimonadaceae bacterium]